MSVKVSVLVSHCHVMSQKEEVRRSGSKSQSQSKVEEFARDRAVSDIPLSFLHCNVCLAVSSSLPGKDESQSHDS